VAYDTSSLAQLTTLHVGGPAQAVVEPTTHDELVKAALSVWADGEEWMVLGGGSNVVIGDDGFPGTVIHVKTSGITRLPDDSSRPSPTVRLRVEAGTGWDELVAYAVDNGLAGIEALSGIPGSCGAAPIQNIGAYGQELSSTLVGVTFLDYLTGELSELDAAQLGLGYRTSVFKQQHRQGIVTAIDLDLFEATEGETAISAPIAYAQLATALGVNLGDQVSISAIREAVLKLRASKGMVLDPNDPDSVSAGSFFTNPVVSERFARGLPANAPRFPMAEEAEEAEDIVVPLDANGSVPGVDLLATYKAGDANQVKLSAAWLIENAGIRRGFSLPGSGAAISSKHSLAIVNTGGASAEEIVELARYVRNLVQLEFGVLLSPEPVLVGVAL
jgi:UDP-N-acetylmuramate dehydrogenase